MADSILRLKVESQEYDNKLKQATNGLTRYVDECRKVGGTLEVVEKDTLDYVRALGQMDTTSRTATGKLAEMKKTFTELSVVYKNMTDQEKNSPFGKALATSLDQLKGRIGESKVQLDDINKSINGGGGLTGALDSLSDKFGMSVQSLAGWGTALAAGKEALDVAKDAFFASEETVDEWGRVMDSSKSLYEGFLTALNTGDISGYLSRIDSIVQAARAAYNELDRLGTMKTIQAPRISAQQTENERMRMMIQTGRYIAPVDGRRATMAEGQRLTKEQIQRIEKQLQNGMKSVVSLVGNEVKQTSRAIDAVYNRQAQELGMSLKEFRKGTSSMAELDKRMAGYEQYQKWRTKHTTIDMQSGREIVARGNPFEQYAKWGTFRVDGERYNNLVGLIQQRDQQAGQVYGMQSQVYRTMNRAEGVTLRQIMGGGRGGGGHTGGKTTGTHTGSNTSKVEMTEEQKLQKQINDLVQQGLVMDEQGRATQREKIAALQEQLQTIKDIKNELLGTEKKEETTPMEEGLSGFNKETMSAWMSGRQKDLSQADYGSAEYNQISGEIVDMTTIQAFLSEALRLGVADVIPELQSMWEEVFDDVNIDVSAFDGIKEKINEAKESVNENPVEIDMSTGNLKDVKKASMGVEDAMIAAGQAVNQVAGALQNIEDPGVKAAAIVAEAIANIALGFAQASKAQDTIASGWGWIAWLAAGAAALATTISTVHSLTGFAGGGVIEGNSYSGDNQLVRVNAGETILTRAQAGVIADALEGSPMSNLKLETYVSGKRLRIVMNNDSMARGQGKLVSSNTLRG